MADNASAVETTGDDTTDTYDIPNVAALSGRRQSTRTEQRPAEPIGQQITVDDIVGDGGAARRNSKATHAIEPDEDLDEDDEGAKAGDRPVTINVSPGVDKRLKAYRQKTRMTNVEIVWEAVEAAHAEGWEAVVASAVPQATGRRFGVRASQIRYAGVGQNSVYTRMTPPEIAELKRLLKLSKLPDRSKLVAICLNWHLPGSKDKP